MLPRVLKNFNTFVDGIGYAGMCEELELPEIKIKTEEVRNGGMDAPREVDMGMEALTAKLTFSEYLTEIMKKSGILGADTVRLTLKGSKKRDGERSIPILAELHGGFKTNSKGSWKTGDLAKLEVEFAASYYKLSIGGERVYEIDVDNMIRFMGDTDVLADIRADIGL